MPLTDLDCCCGFWRRSGDGCGACDVCRAWRRRRRRRRVFRLRLRRKARRAWDPVQPAVLWRRRRRRCWGRCTRCSCRACTPREQTWRWWRGAAAAGRGEREEEAHPVASNQEAREEAAEAAASQEAEEVAPRGTVVAARPAATSQVTAATGVAARCPARSTHLWPALVHGGCLSAASVRCSVVAAWACVVGGHAGASARLQDPVARVRELTATHSSLGEAARQANQVRRSLLSCPLTLPPHRGRGSALDDAAVLRDSAYAARRNACKRRRSSYTTCWATAPRAPSTSVSASGPSWIASQRAQRQPRKDGRERGKRWRSADAGLGRSSAAQASGGGCPWRSRPLCTRPTRPRSTPRPSWRRPLPPAWATPTW